MYGLKPVPFKEQSFSAACKVGPCRDGEGGGNLSIDGATHLVPDVGAADPEDDVAGDVGRVVGNAFESAGDDDRVQGLKAHVRLLLHHFHEVGAGHAIHAVDLVVHDHNRFGELGIGIEQRLDSRADHTGGIFAHGSDIYGQLS